MDLQTLLTRLSALVTLQQGELTALWRNWYFQDVLVFCLVAGLGVLFWRMSRREYWRIAARQLAARPLAVASFLLICLYLLVALLDSVGWHPKQRDDAGNLLRNEQGAPLRDPDGLSMLDLLLTHWRTAQEKSYSAPFAERLLNSEIRIMPDGEVREVRPELEFPGRHPLGTDKIGRDVLFLSLKSVRTGVIIGGLTTLLAIPFAIFFGVVAGYFGGWVDDVIQYFYTVLASIPRILLLISFMLLFGAGLFQLCVIMGITSWIGLCRVLRGETLKLRESEFIQAAEATGLSRARILLAHIVPNVLHVVVITAVLSFSGQVLAETILAYIGVGVGTDTISWGAMINDARMELARQPVVWWKLAAAFFSMLGLVLPANLFGDALRDALDPRLRTR